jgi:formylglycine-generating enzyme required for sulfatase activity
MDRTVAERICRSAYNDETADCEGLIGVYATVGSYEPNAWGLYDMLGNVHEACVDWSEKWSSVYPDDNKIYVDPVGPERGEKTKRIYRGYRANDTAGESVFGISISGRIQMDRAWDTAWGNEGARLCVTLH